jgi:hypothetical protein
MHASLPLSTFGRPPPVTVGWLAVLGRVVRGSWGASGVALEMTRMANFSFMSHKCRVTCFVLMLWRIWLMNFGGQKLRWDEAFKNSSSPSFGRMEYSHICCVMFVTPLTVICFLI